MKEKIGIYGGTFNPPHLGHLNLAIEMLEKCHLSKILFVPNALSPFKQENGLASVRHRINMINLSIEEIPQFSILASEVLRPPPSYTIDTVNELIELSQNKEDSPSYSLIIGQDAVANFHLWHQAAQIVDKVSILVGSRCGFHPPSQRNCRISDALIKGMTETRVFEVSSSEVRRRLAEKKYCGHLVPRKVLDYIYANSLYL